MPPTPLFCLRLEPLPSHGGPPAPDFGVAQRCDHLVSGAFWHVDEGEAPRDLDCADIPSAEACLAGNCPDEVLRPQSRLATEAGVEPSHPRPTSRGGALASAWAVIASSSFARPRDDDVGDVLVIIGTANCSVCQIDGGKCYLHHVELFGQRLHDNPEAVQVVSKDALAKCGAGEVETSLTKVRHRGDLLDRDLLFGGLLDCFEHPVLARFCQSDGHALSPGASHPPHSVDVTVHR